MEEDDACTMARVLMDEPEKVADYLAEYVRMSFGRVKSIYFACPPTEMEFILKIRKILRKDGVKVYTAREMIGFLDKNFVHCDEVRINNFEIFSMS